MTINILKNWRYGQTQSENLCGGILSTEGFSSIDPQSPLGGPDGIKDIICSKGDKKWIAGVFFPPTEQKYGNLDKVIESSGENKVNAIADFHREFLFIHPFIDGNGRVARVLLYQQSSDLLKKRISDPHLDRKIYFEALQAGHSGNPKPFRELMKKILGD